MKYVDIGGYEVKRKLSSNDTGLSVFDVVEKETGSFFILRLADFSNKSTDFRKTQWSQLHDEYRQVISEFTHLPRLIKMEMIDQDYSYALLDGDEGETLAIKGELGFAEITQLIDAVRHLHENKMIHGSITAENIWITTEGRLILYGTGEAKIFEGKARVNTASDIRQLVTLFQKYAKLRPSTHENLRLEQPMTLDEVEKILKNADKKLGLSEDNKIVAFLERKSMNQKKEPAKRVIFNRNLILGGAIILGVLILAVYFKMN
ncbi:MAG: Protein kinase domain [Neobacillus sp.]|nr:Protein kinase domain [Neobacillus sp.]